MYGSAYSRYHMNSIASEQTKKAQDLGAKRRQEEPYDVWPLDKGDWPPFPFPHFDDAKQEPPGWKLEAIIWVSFDDDGNTLPEYVLRSNVEEFKDLVVPGRGYAFIAPGQIAEYSLRKGSS